MTPLERMARAICREEHILRFGEEIWRRGELDKKANQFWREHVPAARAALSAIEEPSDKMVKAAEVLDDQGSSVFGEPFVACSHDEAWTAMIRAALEEGP